MHSSKKEIRRTYVDAAGDPGLQRSPNSSAAYVVAATDVTSREQLEAEMAELRRRADVADPIELHHRRLKRGLAEVVYRELAKMAFVASVVVVRKADHAGRGRRPNALVVELAA